MEKNALCVHARVGKYYQCGAELDSYGWVCSNCKVEFVLKSDLLIMIKLQEMTASFVERHRDRYRKLWLNRVEALKRPCPNCDYIQAAIVPK